jgi:hypothetical protein
VGIGYARAAGYVGTQWGVEVIFKDAALAAVFMLMGASLVLVISQNWRWMLAAFAMQYLAVFWLVALNWPIGLAAIKLVVGVMVGAVLASSRSGDEVLGTDLSGIPGLIFRTLAAVLVWALVFSIAPDFERWIPTQRVILQGGLVLIGMGLLQLGMSNRPPRVVLGLLTGLAGFEIIYAAVESSILVAGMLGVVNLGLALTGVYLLLTGGMSEETEGEQAAEELV